MTTSSRGGPPITHTATHSPAELAKILRVTPATVRTWIRNKRITATKASGRWLIPLEGNSDVLLALIRRDLSGADDVAYVPDEIARYEQWHQMLDEFVWLIKVCYSPAQALKHKQFRLDHLFAGYLRAHSIRVASLRRHLGRSGPTMKRAIEDDLKRGWYNELAYAMPLRPNTLGLSFGDIEQNKEASSDRLAFASWRIAQAYYASYFYLRSIVLRKVPDIRLQAHQAPINAFNSSCVESLEQCLWHFPFSIRFTPKRSFVARSLYLRKVHHVRYRYAEHPRAPRRNPDAIAKRLHSTYRTNANKARAYGVWDYLRDFRTWANYREIDNLLSLFGPGYRSFMDQNLSVIQFFIGGMAELAFIATHGRRAYMRELQRFHDLMSADDFERSREIAGSPMLQRAELFRRLGVIGKGNKVKTAGPANVVSIRP